MIRALVTAFAALSSCPVLAQIAAFEATQRSYSTGLVATGQGYYPQGHVLADLDGDGDLDVIVANIGNFIAGRFSILLNHGDGTLEAPVFVQITTPMTTETADVAAGDFDGDGDIDLAFCAGSYGTTGQTVGVFKNNGNATFAPMQAYACGRGPTGIVALDADRDGDLDLATANNYWNESDLSVLYNDGQGVFANRVDFAVGASTQPYKLSAGDLNGDNWPDLAVSIATSTAAVAVLINDGAGAYGAPLSLPPPPNSTVNGIPGVCVADVDNDGDRDVLYSAGAQVGPWSSIGLYRNNGNATFAALESLAVTIGSGHDFAVGDVTGDGWPDIACVGHSDKYGYSLLRGNGSGGFLPEQNFRSGEMSRSISLGDMDGDGDRDVVIADSGSDTITVHTNVAGSFSMPYAVTTEAFTGGIASGDIDGDGDRDVVTTNTRIWSLFNNGQGAFTPSLQNANFGSLTFPKLRDVDGDGYVDLLVRSSAVLLARNEGVAFPGFFQQLTALPTGSVSDFELADVDNDGDQDVVGTVNGSGPDRVVVVKNLGAGNFSGPSFASSWSVVGGLSLVTGDLDNDGDQDVVYGGGNAIAWLNDGSGTLSGPISSPAAGGLLRMAKGDFNGDGKLDIAGTSYDYNGAGENVVVLLGQGNGTFGAPAVYYGMFSVQYGGATGIATIDADQDGDLDLVCGAYGGNDVVLFRNAGNGTFGAGIGYGTSGTVTSLHVADVNADGRADVLAEIGTEPPIGGAVQVLFGKSGAQFPTAYCTAGTSSHNCAPQLGSSGTPSASAATSFSLSLANVDGQRQGLFFYGVSGRVAVPWGPSSSWLCVKTPTQRSTAQWTGGNLFACDGGMTLDWNAFVAATPNALGSPFHAGAVLDAQGWWRDPGSAKTTALSNGLEFTLQP